MGEEALVHDQAVMAEPSGTSRPTPPGTMSPNVLAYAVGPLALVLLMVLRTFDLVAQVSVWAYLSVIAGAQISGRLVERWPDAPPGTARLHLRVAVHVAAVTSVIYLSGWGPALGMAYAFSAMADLHQSGASAWRAARGWSLVGCAVGQALVFLEVAPSMLTRDQAQTIGLLGAFVFVIAIYMAGSVGEHRERVEALLEDQTRMAAAATEHAQRSEAHHRAVVEQASEGILTVDVDGRILSFNAAAEAMFGWLSDEIAGRPVTTIFPVNLHGPLGGFLERNRVPERAEEQVSGIETMGARRDGSQFPMAVSTSAITLDGSTLGISAILRDLSIQKQVEAQLVHQALHDPLTGLPNRALLADRIDSGLAAAHAATDQSLAVLLIDLDHFKRVNDTLGHDAGDELLRLVGQRLCDVLRPQDTVARFGGDEFVIVASTDAASENTLLLAERILAGMRRPFDLAAGKAFVSASIGIAVSTRPTDSAASLLRDADSVMYEAKRLGRDQFAVFDKQLRAHLMKRAGLERDLRSAMERGELLAHYQPVVDSSSGQVVSVEALVRWAHPVRGLVPPDEFIPIAEDTGLVHPIGRWMLHEACAQLAEWNRRGLCPGLGMSVNVSPLQLNDSSLVEDVERALAASGVEASDLRVELTETMVVRDLARAVNTIESIVALGVGLIIDDFGTGFSSLNYLKRLPITCIKIDKSFIRNVATDRADRAIVAAVSELAEGLGVITVAEGVETDAQLQAVRGLGCSLVQGYHYAPALAPADLERWLERRAVRHPAIAG